MKINEIILEQKLNEDILNEVSWLDVKKAIVGGLISLTALGLYGHNAKDISQMSPDEVKQLVLQLSPEEQKQVIAAVDAEVDPAKVEPVKSTPKPEEYVPDNDTKLDSLSVNVIQNRMEKIIARGGAVFRIEGDARFRILGVRLIIDQDQLVRGGGRNYALATLVKRTSLRTGEQSFSIYASTNPGTGVKVIGMPTDFDADEEKLARIKFQGMGRWNLPERLYRGYNLVDGSSQQMKAAYASAIFREAIPELIRDPK